MKILVLSPVDEQHAISSLKLTEHINNNNVNKTFEMAGYADFLVQTKKAKNWEEAVLKTFITLNIILKDKNIKNILIIGNAPKNYFFDEILSYDDGEEAIDYKDNFLELLQEKTKDNKELYFLIHNLYTKEDSKMNLKDTKATQELLIKLLNIEDRGQELENAIQQYEQWIKKHTFR